MGAGVTGAAWLGAEVLAGTASGTGTTLGDAVGCGSGTGLAGRAAASGAGAAAVRGAACVAVKLSGSMAGSSAGSADTKTKGGGGGGGGGDASSGAAAALNSPAPCTSVWPAEHLRDDRDCRGDPARSMRTVSTRRPTQEAQAACMRQSSRCGMCRHIMTTGCRLLARNQVTDAAAHNFGQHAAT